MKQIISKPFQTMRTEEERANDKVAKIAIKFNLEEQAKLKQIKQLLQQTKDGTAIKQCIDIASEVLLEQKTKTINSIILNNYRKNKRLNIVDFD